MLEAARTSNDVFDPVRISELRKALELACAQVATGSTDKTLRGRLAAIIVGAAQADCGRDPQGLAETALSQLAVWGLVKSDGSR